MKKSGIFFFVYYPRPGLVKQEIAREAGENIAAAIYHELIRYTFHHLSKLHEHSNIILFYYPYEDIEKIKALFGEQEFNFEPMPKGGTIGERLSRAFEYMFNIGFKKVVYAHIDSPSLSFNIVDQTIKLLNHYQAVIGPSENGDIYLFGIKDDSNRALFLEEIAKLDSFRLNDTIDLCKNLELSYTFLDESISIDSLKDWEEFVKKLEDKQKGE